MAAKKSKPIDLRDPPTLYALVSALPPGKQADRAWAEYAAVCRAHAHLVTMLALIGVDEARIAAPGQADEQTFAHEVAVAYREHIEDCGYIWVPEVARARQVARGEWAPREATAMEARG